MSVDDRLLSNQATAQPLDRPETSADRAGALRDAQRNEEEATASSANMGWQEQMAAAKKQWLLKAKTKTASMQKSLSSGSSKLLQAAWKNIVTTFGFSFFYVYVHLFLKNVFGSRFFAPLGSEWFDRNGITLVHRDSLGSKFRLVETIIVLIVSLLLFFLIISAMSVSAMIMEVVTNPLRSAIAILSDYFPSWVNRVFN